jgi:hypothetical protein
MSRCSSLEVPPFDSSPVSQSRHREDCATCARLTFGRVLKTTGPAVDWFITIVTYVGDTAGAVVEMEVRLGEGDIVAAWRAAVHPAIRITTTTNETNESPRV